MRSPAPPASPPTKKSATPAGVAQHDLAVQLGLSLDDLKKLRDRHLEAPADWIPGRPILFTEAGVQKIRALLGLPALAEGSTGADTIPELRRLILAAPSARAPSPNRATLTVVRPARGCTHIVLCQDADGRPATLRVRNGTSHLFTAGLALPGRCVQNADAPDLYTYEGRPPRRKGRL